MSKVDLLEPKCLSSGKGYGYSAAGYLIPCCWLDPADANDLQKHLQVRNIFYREELKLSNVETIDDIINSYSWKKFYNTLINDQENALDICKKYCSKKKVSKITEHYKLDEESEKRTNNSKNTIRTYNPSYEPEDDD